MDFGTKHTERNRSRTKSLNIFHLLLDRENGIDRLFVRHRRSDKNFNLQFFKCITPNLSILNVEKPSNFIRKFSPDGKYLICFSKDQQSIENYKFLGTTNACELLYKWKTEFVTPNATKCLAEEIRKNIFDRLFKMNWSIRLTSFMRPLYREFSIFTDDGLFVIVASNTDVQEDNLPSYYTLNTINRMHLDYDLNIYRFYMVKLSDGTVTDTLEYSYDFINLSHNHGVSVYKNLVAVVSLFHQWIDIVQLSNGKFIKLFTIGRFFHGTNECLCNNVPEYEEECLINDMRFAGLKHKLLASLYTNIIKTQILTERQALLKQFYKRFNLYQSLEIYKVQFIDLDNMLIRYDIRKHNSSSLEVGRNLKLFVVYNISTDKIVKIFPENSTDLLNVLRNFFEDFFHTRSIYTGRAPSSASNNVYLKHAQMRLIKSCPNGESEAACRLLPQLPVSTQSYSVSPYLDLNLFHYDDTLISALERPKFLSCSPVQFYDRETNLALFRVYSIIPEMLSGGEPNQNWSISSKELVAYTFHPFEPFIISKQKVAHKVRFIFGDYLTESWALLSIIVA